ncbi:capsular polysaccharide export protein, LipB/KpsS family [Methylolobus aquaticus]
MIAPDAARVGVFSRGLVKTLRGSAFLDYPVVFDPRPDDPRIALTAGWGCKPSGEKAAAFAARRGIPCLRLEDGFLRSVGLGALGTPPLSVVVDDRGIYYDASQPSQLEGLLNDADLSPDLLARAERLRSLIADHHLSKYNHAPDADAGLLAETGRPRVLLIDQTAGDASIRCGLADENTFRKLLTAARDENRGADLYVKTHPDVIAGKKRSALAFARSVPGLVWITADVSPPSLLRQVDRVYTVTSQIGFEAALLGKPVSCFGLPFYAGWGVTDDRLSCARRTRRRTVLEILAAAYILYPRYVDPKTGRRCEVERVAEYLATARSIGPRRSIVSRLIARWRT